MVVGSLRSYFDGDLLKRMARSAGLEGVTLVPASNVSNASDGSCGMLVESGDMKDGKIPQVLGIALAVWLVSK